MVNVGRGTVIDEPALIDALHTGQVGFAALDVFATEPLPVTAPVVPAQRADQPAHRGAEQARGPADRRGVPPTTPPGCWTGGLCAT